MTPEQIRSLLDPGAYPDPTETVRLLQTHVSWLLVTDRFVYKIKKPVNLGFLDFTTFEARRHFCHEELRLNRRLSPQVYQEVVPVRYRGDTASFREGNLVIDHAVKMVRLPDELMMDRLLARDEVTSVQVREVARLVGEFHRNARRGPEIDAGGSPKAIRANWEENYAIVGRFVGDTILAPDYDLIRDWANRFMDEHEQLFLRRVAGGFIVEGDGDLHSGNICLTDPPAIFDCIEFNERFRCLDTAADIAFLLMDLNYYGRQRLIPAFLETYRSVTGDTEAETLLTFYQVYRAFIRGEVESIKASQPGLPPGEREQAARSARRHFRLARGLILRPRLSPTLFITCGLSGTGKSVLAEELAFQMGIDLFSSDRVRKELAGIPPTQRHRGNYGEGIYAEGVTRVTYDRLRELTEPGLAAGESVIVDATFRDPAERSRMRSLAEQQGVRFVILWTRCSDEEALARLDEREQRGDAVSDARPAMFADQKGEFVPPDPGEGTLITIDTEAHFVHTVDVVLTSLGVLPCGPD